MQAEPLIGIICDDRFSLLAGRIKAAGYRIVRLLPEKLIPGEIPSVNVWVVDCSDDADVAEAMAWIEPRVLALSNRPDPSRPHDYRQWCERIIRTLDKWTADIWHQHSGRKASSSSAFADVEAVWVLAASTGGVSAVSEFFRAFTHIPRVAFVYAQHIHANQQQLLTAIGHANRGLVCSLAVGRHWLNPGHVLIVPAACRLKFSRHGDVFSVRDQWGTAETPNINQLMMTMSGLKPSPAGAIIFSGAGRDGCEGLRALQAVGTRIWAQDPGGADAPSMPQAAIDAELTSVVASPRDLAAEFMAIYPE